MVKGYAQVIKTYSPETSEESLVRRVSQQKLDRVVLLIAISYQLFTDNSWILLISVDLPERVCCYNLNSAKFRENTFVSERRFIPS